MRTRTGLIALGLMWAFMQFAGIVKAEETVIARSRVGECALGVEVNDNWHTLRLRAHHPGYRGCRIDKDSMLSVLGSAFSEIGSRPSVGAFTSLSIGRIIDYPWISQYLANTAYGDRGWNSRRGKPAALDINKYVSGLLSRTELTEPIGAALAKGGYRVVGVTVEKVLVGGFREVPPHDGPFPPGRVPYDAQVWFRIEKD